MKRIITIIIIIALVAGLIPALSACGGSAPSEEELSAMVAEAVISGNEGSYLQGECCGEGHIVLGSKLSGDRLKIYALTMFGNYGFRNDMFIKVSGSGVIPAVLTFERVGEEFRLLEIEYPQDGAGYVKSIKRMFPLKYRAAARYPGNRENEDMVAQERSYAEAYLESIGRDAKIGDYRDLNVVLLTDLGVSVEVSNELTCDKLLWQYPYWIGTIETLEDGKRYIRKLFFNEAEGKIIYETYEKESGTVTESFVYDADTGELIEQSGPAQQ